MRSNSSLVRAASVSLCAFLIVVLWAIVASSSASASLITPVKITTTSVSNPIGIQYDELKNELLLSLNYYNGLPNNFDLVNSLGVGTPFTAESGLTDEVYMAAIRNTAECPAVNGFSEGEVFFGTGTPGKIGQILPNGTVEPNWETLSGESGILRGGIAQACTGPFSGDLIVTTTAGDVWLVPQHGHGLAKELATHIAGDTWEGPATIPPIPAKYGPWAGKILVASEGCGCVESIEAGTGAVVQYPGFTSSGIGAEGVHVVPEKENFYAADYADAEVIGIPAKEFEPYVGDVIVTEELKGNITDVHWNPAANGGKGAFEDKQILKPVGQIEGSTFAKIAVAPLCFEGCEHWLSDGKPTPEGQPEKAKTSGNLTFVVDGQPCATKVTDEETIVNPVGGGSGTDEDTSFNVAPCKKAKTGPCPSGVEIVAQNLPWKSHLLEGTPEPDPTEGMEFEVRCHGKVLAIYAGTLTPLLGESTLTLNEASGALKGTGEDGTLSISGTEKVVGPKGDTKITSGPPTKNVWNIEKTQTISWGKLTFTWSRTVNEGVSNRKHEEIEEKCREEKLTEQEFEACVAEVEAKVRDELLQRCEEEFAEGKYKSFEECLKAHETRKETIVLTCKKSDAGNIWNEKGEGLDETVLFDLYECSSETCPDPVVKASDLPWPSTLEESPVGSGVIRDRTRGMQLRVECGPGKEEGAFAETFTGEPTPRWRNGSSKTGPSYDEFGEGSGVLTGEPGNELKISGNDYTAGFEKGELLTASTVFNEKGKKTG
jgi:hypothetical protein